MTTTDPEPERSTLEQHNHGSGAFVGRDNHGTIKIETLDPKTKALLGRMHKQFPDLARLLKRSLLTGVISEDTASALSLAARSINEDVAHTIWQAAQRLNEDVAGLLTRASHSINEDVASQMMNAADSLSKASMKLDFDELDRAVSRLQNSLNTGANDDLSSLVSRLETGVESFGRLSNEMDRLQSANTSVGRIEQLGTLLSGVADRIEATVTPPPPRLLPDHRGRMTAFFWGLGIGAALVFWMMVSR